MEVDVGVATVAETVGRVATSVGSSSGTVAETVGTTVVATAATVGSAVVAVGVAMMEVAVGVAMMEVAVGVAMMVVAVGVAMMVVSVAQGSVASRSHWAAAGSGTANQAARATPRATIPRRLMVSRRRTMCGLPLTSYDDPASPSLCTVPVGCVPGRVPSCYRIVRLVWSRVYTTARGVSIPQSACFSTSFGSVTT